ncbi:MAG: molecular chaperone [Pseudomonadota bacterium]|nr:molecular chaperone [Pseudomonadota bacterium]
MKRFYREVATAQHGSGWRVTLDGRPIKTAGSRAQIVPSLALATALAAEWDGQDDTIDPTRFVLRDMADYAIDVVATGRGEVQRAILGFAESDTLCYRGDPDEALWAHQQQQWEPLLTAAESRWDIYFVRVCGIIHRPQPPETLTRLAAVVAALDDFTLAALHTLTSLAASLVLGLAALEADADIPALWAAAHVEEDWQAALWGRDEEAAARQMQRGVLFTAAAEFVRLLRVAG